MTWEPELPPFPVLFIGASHKFSFGQRILSLKGVREHQTYIIHLFIQHSLRANDGPTSE